jgi:hypothetical protein
MKSIRMIWQCDILSRHRMSIYYDRANYSEALDNLRKSINYREFVKHCQVEHNITHDILSWRYDVV